MPCCRRGASGRAPLLRPAASGARRACRMPAAAPERRGEHPVRDEAPGQRGQHACGRQLHAGRAEVRPLGRDLWHAASRMCRSCNSPPTSAPSIASSTCSNRKCTASSRMHEAAMLGQVPAAAPADLRHGRNVQSGDRARRLRLQPSRARPSATRWIELSRCAGDRIMQTTFARADQSARRAP